MTTVLPIFVGRTVKYLVGTKTENTKIVITTDVRNPKKFKNRTTGTSIAKVLNFAKLEIHTILIPLKLYIEQVSKCQSDEPNYAYLPL